MYSLVKNESALTESPRPPAQLSFKSVHTKNLPVITHIIITSGRVQNNLNQTEGNDIKVILVLSISHIIKIVSNYTIHNIIS